LCEGVQDESVSGGDGGYLVVSNGRNGEVQDLVFKMKRHGVFGLEEFERFEDEA
jgi:hypothetical protein